MAGVEAERDDRRDDVRRESREFGHESSHEARAVLPFIGGPGAGRGDLFDESAENLMAAQVVRSAMVCDIQPSLQRGSSGVGPS